MNKKIVSIIVVLMMSLLILPATSSPTKLEEPIIKTKPQQQVQILIVCVIDITGEGQIWTLPGALIWRIDSGNIKITYLGGEYTATSGRGMFILHIGPPETSNPVVISGLSPICIIF